jgi:hypothetical protein
VAFNGVDGLTQFPEAPTEHAAVILYERMLLDALPDAYARIHRAEQRLAELDRRGRTDDPDSSLARSSARLRGRRRAARWRQESTQEGDAVRRELHRARVSLEALEGEVSSVRDWLDAFVAAAEEYVAVRPEMRRELGPPSMPPHARSYATVQDFLDENPARLLADGHPRAEMDATGADFGFDWTWQEPETPWVVTRWRVSYIDELKEVYAYEIHDPRTTPFIPFEEREDAPRRVWLLASEFEVEGERAFFSNPTWEYLGSLQSTLMHQRNSLILLVEALADRQRLS